MLVCVIHQEFVHFSAEHAPAVREHFAHGENHGSAPAIDADDVRTRSIYTNVYTSSTTACDTAQALCRGYAGTQGYLGQGRVAYSYWGVTRDGQKMVNCVVVVNELIEG